MSPESQNIATVMAHADTMRKTGDGRLMALIGRSLDHVRAEFPGQMKQVEKSKTVKGQMDKLIWDHAKPRVLRFLKNHSITLKLA
jgi:hypothetical protein